MTLSRNAPLTRKPGSYLQRTPFPRQAAGLAPAPWARTVPGVTAMPVPAGKIAATRRPGTSSGRAHGFPPAVAALLDARDPWCVYCGSPRNLHRHHRRLKGVGGDGRDHTQCACNGVRLCADHHAWVHSGAGRRGALEEGLIIPRSTVEPWTLAVLVHLEDDRGGVLKYPSCDGRWLDAAELEAA